MASEEYWYRLLSAAMPRTVIPNVTGRGVAVEIGALRETEGEQWCVAV